MILGKRRPSKFLVCGQWQVASGQWPAEQPEQRNTHNNTQQHTTHTQQLTETEKKETKKD